MKLKKISLKNIRSYENAEIEFPSGSTLLSGDIGTGKSSVLLALEFALFGLQRGNLSGAGLLRTGANSGAVQVEMEIEGREFAIERTLKRSKSTVVQDKACMIVNNQRQEMSANELKQKILEILNYPAELLTKTNLLYRFTIYTPQEEMKQILLEDRETRINTLRKVFGIDKYKNINENSKFVLSKIRELLRNKEGLIADLAEIKEKKEKQKKEIEVIKLEIDKISPLIEEAQKILVEKKAENKEIENKLEQFSNIKLKITEKKAEEREILEKIQDTEETIKEMNNKIHLLEEELKGIVLEASSPDFEREIEKKHREKSNVEFEYIECEKRISSLNTEKNKIQKEINDITQLSICSVCHQKVTSEHKQTILYSFEKEMKNKERQMHDLENEKKEAEIKLKKINAEVAELQKKEKEIYLIKFKFKSLEERRAETEKLKFQKKLFEEKVSQSREKINELAEELSTFHGIEEEYRKIKEDMEEAQQNEREIAIRKAEFIKEFSNSKLILEGIDAEILRKDRIKDDIIYLKKLHDWLLEQFLSLVNLIEKSVMLVVQKEFNSLFEKWFSMLTEQLSARLDEDFTPIIEQQGYELDYDFLSGGERTAAALAYRLSLNQVINRLITKLKTSDILILDEPTDGFSSEQIEKMKDILAELKMEQIILVSHESQVESFVDNIIRFEKEGNITSVNK